MFGRAKRNPSDQLALDRMRSLSDAVERTQAVIRFTPDGHILTANDNFLKVMGYELEDIVGKHHSIFVDPSFAKSAAYREFWLKLANGENFTDQFPRITKDGTIIWIQGTYAADVDETGKTVSVIKIASDITKRQEGIESLARGIAELGKGNLTHRVQSSGDPNIDKIVTALNSATEELSTAMASAKAVSQTVGQMAEEVGSASSGLSTRTENQAAALEETAAALHELVANVKAAAEGTNLLETNADRVKKTAESSRDVVDRAVGAMSEIKASSKHISKITSVIEDIAFQTNLLALNAGVEAARAGDTGRGFAVVASEVRALAHRSTEAALEIKNLIEQSSARVEGGVEFVGQVGEELKRIIAGISDMYANIREIATGTTEQSLALDEINSGVSHLDTMTQQNAAMAEEFTASSQVLARDARRLLESISAFQTSAIPQSAEMTRMASVVPMSANRMRAV